jgi:acyl carrier protein
MGTDPKIPNIYDAVVKILANELEIDESRILPKSHILNDLGGDSLQIVEIIMTLE